MSIYHNISITKYPFNIARVGEQYQKNNKDASTLIVGNSLRMQSYSLDKEMA